MEDDIRFALNLQMIADGLQDRYAHIRVWHGETAQQLKSVCFYQNGAEPNPHSVYIARAKELEIKPKAWKHCTLIIVGEVTKELESSSYSMIEVPGDADLMELLNVCQEIIQKHFLWAEKLQNIVMQEGTVDDLCRASYPYFQNPLFVHDSRLNVISCPVWREEMIKWEKDESTGLLITPLESLNELKTDREYLQTLTTEGADIFSADLRGYRDIYVNIWDDFGGYEARLVICELEKPFRPGEFAAAEYLARLVKLTLAKRGRMDHTYKRALEVMLQGMIEGKEFSDAEISSRIEQCGWKLGDRYICIRMDAEEQEGNPGSAPSVCNYVEARVIGSKAVCNEQQICIIINLNMNNHYTSDMGTILRDGLFKAGISNEFQDFKRLPVYYRQASTALDYCRKKNDMMWSYTFGDIAMDYLADYCCTEFSAEDLCAYELKKLKAYDVQNKTELYKTLVTYILNERNTVATSKNLYVGRSTLFYRLRKISQITGLNPENFMDPKKNLYFRLSVYLTEKETEDEQNK